jgi:NCAIR mutase (PurE)-related protein
MNEESLRDLLGKVRKNETTPEDAVRLLKQGPFKVSSSSEATPDHHRRLRHGLCEVIYGAGKTVEQTMAIARELSEDGNPVLITRLDEEKKYALGDAFPGSRVGKSTGTLLLNPPTPIAPGVSQPHVAIVSAGTSDLFVAEEAAETCVATQTPYRMITDVGIAGLHRILQRIDDLEAASALVIIAGMEGALPSVVGGLVGKPIFAVPTSVGYGANLGGITALLAMLNSCSPGIAVVNIDNGFSAGYAACRVVSEINRKRENADQ